MPVYHFTWHAYRSWNPDHPRGYTVKGAGYKPPDPEKADQYDRNAKQNGVLFDDAIQEEILVFSNDICKSERLTLEACGFDRTHVHELISWRRFVKWEWVGQRMKNLLALKFNRRRGTPGKRWFVRRHGAPRRVERRSHYEHLLTTYFPDHPGLFWERGMPLPELPAH